MKLIDVANGEAIIAIPEKELVFLCHAITETLEAVRAWEFKTRTAETPEKAKDLMLQLENCLEEIVKREKRPQS